MAHARLRERAFVGLQYLLPQHLLSGLVYHLTRSRIGWLKNLLIGAFMRGFKPDMSEAEVPDPRAYSSFNAFFTRGLRTGTRPEPAEASAIASPVDGTVSQAGELREDRIYQAKGRDYTLGQLLAESTDQVELFRGGCFCHHLSGAIQLPPHPHAARWLPARRMARAREPIQRESEHCLTGSAAICAQ